MGNEGQRVKVELYFRESSNGVSSIVTVVYNTMYLLITNMYFKCSPNLTTGI